MVQGVKPRARHTRPVLHCSAPPCMPTPSPVPCILCGVVRDLCWLHVDCQLIIPHLCERRTSKMEGGRHKWKGKKKEDPAEGAVGVFPAEGAVGVSPAEGAVGVSPEEEAADSPRSRWSLKRKPPQECPLDLHPLQYRWALWFFKNDRSRAWHENLHLVTKITTVEDFWAMYSHLKLPSKLSSGCDYALFKEGIQPMWEDYRNKRGGRWLVSLAKQQRHIELDRLWLETLLCLIGESFDEYSKEVCGAVVNIRTKGDKIAVWTSEAENQTGVLHIGHIYKERLGLSSKTIIGYQAHADTAAKSNSLAKNKFVV